MTKIVRNILLVGSSLLLLSALTIACGQQNNRVNINNTNPISSSIGYKANPGKEVAAHSLKLNPSKGLVYLLNQKNQPFTGTSISHYPNGEKAATIEYIKGKKHGKYYKWFTDGTKSFEANYINGKQDGKTETWWKNGNKRSTSNYENGVPNGIQQQWYKSGAKFKKMNLINGREEGLQQSWRENGKLYNNYEARNGRIFGLKRAALCYELDQEVVQFDSKK